MRTDLTAYNEYAASPRSTRAPAAAWSHKNKARAEAVGAYDEYAMVESLPAHNLVTQAVNAAIVAATAANILATYATDPHDFCSREDFHGAIIVAKRLAALGCVTAFTREELEFAWEVTCSDLAK